MRQNLPLSVNPDKNKEVLYLTAAQVHSLFCQYYRVEIKEFSILGETIPPEVQEHERSDRKC